MHDSVVIRGKVARVGDFVCFRECIDQGGWIDRIKGNLLFIRNPNGFLGPLAANDVAVVRVEDCWL